MLAATVAVFILDRVPVAIVAIGVALSLWATGVLGFDQSLAGFGDPTVIFIATLFVVSEALDASGVTAWAGQELIARVGESRTRLIVLMLLLVAFLTALISVNGSVAALLPVVVVLSVRLGRPSVAAPHAARLRGPRRIAARADRLARQRDRLRSREGRGGRRDSASSSSRSSGSPSSSGRSRSSSSSASASCRTAARARWPRTSATHARTLVEQYELDQPAGSLLTRTSGVAEVVIPPRSALVGDTVFPGMVTDSGDLVVLAVQRRGEDLGPGESTLAVGRHAAPAGHVGRARAPPRRPGRARGRRARRASGGRRSRSGRAPGARSVVLAGMVVLLATGAVPPAVGRAPRSRGARPAARAHHRAGLPRHLLDDRDPRRRDDVALDRDGRDGSRPAARRRARATSSATPARTRCCSGSSCSRSRSAS